MAIYKDKTPTDNHERDRWKVHVLRCPDCETEYPNPEKGGRTRCPECGAHGLVPSDTVVCGRCFVPVPSVDWPEHKEVCEL